MLETHKRNPLISWYLGLFIVVIGDGYVAWRMYSTACLAPLGAELIFVLVIPLIYIALMYLTLKSQP